MYEHAGKQYHIQAEDLGVERGCIEVRVYDGGSMLWHKRLPYSDLLEKNLSLLEQDESLRQMIEKTLHTVEAAIAKGKLT
jgi:hypothetical protein